jgi:hypothetical protein
MRQPFFLGGVLSFISKEVPIFSVQLLFSFLLFNYPAFGLFESRTSLLLAGG